MARQLEGLLLNSVELFCLVAQHQGFTAAARAAGMTTAAVSRAVNRLENQLGVRLLTRTTRRVRLTDAGERYYTHCRQAIGQLAEAAREAAGQQASPTGTIRISLPTSYGHRRVLPVLAEFAAQYPGIAFDLQLTNRNIRFEEEGFDLAIRGRTPPDSGLIARKLEDSGLVVVATPAYLKTHGVPATPADLAHHACIGFVLPSTGTPVPWLFQAQGEALELAPPARFTCSEDILGPVTLARHGTGLAQTYRFLVDDDLKAGSLIEVLGEFSGASRPFSLLYPSNRHLPLRVRLFIEFLLARFQPPGG
ncbi:MAG: LysR family transcriptional regulator [Thiobacillus sp.]|nr:LysR family transcriptional regulator [Thiobacillus sp.]